MCTDGFSTKARTRRRARVPGQLVARGGRSRRPVTGDGLDADRDQPVVAGDLDREPHGLAEHPGSVITWSAAKDPITASGSRRSSIAAARPIAAIESRATARRRSTSTSSPGSCSATASRCAPPVTTSTRSPTRGPSRSRVPWIRVRPEPVRSRRNFGAAARDSGQSRVPAPPAGTTAQKWSIGPDDSRRTVVQALRWRRVTTFAEILDARAAGVTPVARWSRGTTRRPASAWSCSVATYANWVAKTASLLVEEHDLERGDALRVDLPLHWLRPVFLGAAWTAGLVVTRTATTPDAVVCGPDGLERWAPCAADLPVLACSLLPMGVRFAEPLPPGVHDVGVEVWSQPDAFLPYDPPTADDPASPGGGTAPTPSCGARPPPGVSSPTAAASWLRRTRLPHRSSPPSPSRSRAAARWSGGRPRHGSRRRGADRVDGLAPAERTSSHGSADQVVVLQSAGQHARARANPLAAALDEQELALAGLAHHQVRRPGRPTSPTPTTQSYFATSRPSAAAGQAARAVARPEVSPVAVADHAVRGAVGVQARCATSWVAVDGAVRGVARLTARRPPRRGRSASRRRGLAHQVRLPVAGHVADRRQHADAVETGAEPRAPPRTARRRRRGVSVERTVLGTRTIRSLFPSRSQSPALR